MIVSQYREQSYTYKNARDVVYFRKGTKYRSHARKNKVVRGNREIVWMALDDRDHEEGGYSAFGQSHTRAEAVMDCRKTYVEFRTQGYFPPEVDSEPVC